MNDRLLENCIVRLSRGEKISPQVSLQLRPIDPATIHEYRLLANTHVELHFHDFDEYWLFTKGNPQVTLRNAEGSMKQFKLELGDMVVCIRGIEHTLCADHELVYFQFSSIRVGDERPGHLTRTFEK